MNRFWTVLNIGMLTLLLIFTVSSADAMEPMVNQPSPLLGQPAPSFDIADDEFRQQTFADIRDGQKAILYFWATWCPHCRRELQEIQRRRKEFVEQEIAVMLIDIGENRKEVGEYMRRAGLTMKVYLDWDGKISDRYGVRGLPTYVFIDESGTVTAFEHRLPQNFLALFQTANP